MIEVEEDASDELVAIVSSNYSASLKEDDNTPAGNSLSVSSATVLDAQRSSMTRKNSLG